MNNRRASEIKKRIEKRKRQKVERYQDNQSTDFFDERKYMDELNSPYIVSSGQQKGDHPILKIDRFLFKMLLSACLVLIVAIIYKQDAPFFDNAKVVIEDTMEQEFQYAMVANWYQEQFGSPLAFFDGSTKGKMDSIDYVVPASGIVTESFLDNGQGIQVETVNKEVEAVGEGIVVFVGEKENLGRTVILQHSDGTDTWYGELGDIQVSLYDYVDRGSSLGSVKKEEEEKGTYYFAIQKDDTFIDPIQVIDFD
ncbi:M23 family metallopeptidase [Bacillus carboniphilus]|uniref:M23 family metallopeptidase n=1 Tax=Bacillus carboniphilus TaxID=86663 RepID=A0ABY9JXH9_9BACI|nr:M23 family metallopeptidase [Bacillus carboniphilus]WLR44082.1 M23 family metallopeptidase [Bacillus carboniphilus]